MDEIKLLCQRFERKKSERSNWDDIWEEIALYSMPGKADFITERTSGDRSRNLEIYDPTAAVSNHTLASHMHASMTSPASKWFEQRFKGGESGIIQKQWVEGTTDRMFEAINDSNFVSVINELYQNLIAFGTACIEVTYVNTVHEGFKLVFRDVDLASLVFMENVHGRVDTVFHEMKQSARQAKQLLGDVKVEKLEEKLKKDPDCDVKLLRIVRPNPKFDPMKTIDQNARPFESIYVFEKQEVLRQGYFELPYMVPRWSKMTTEPYGYGPGLLALPDVKTLNEAKRLELRGWEKAIDPPIWGMAGAIVGNLHLEASGFTKVRDRNAMGTISEGTQWGATQVKSQEIRNNVQSVYLIDQLILPERPNATATEVQIRYEMMQKVLGPTMGRLEAELLNPMVNRIFGIMMRNGQFEEMPPELQGMETEVRYTGPLARAQTSEEAVAIERLVAFIMGTAQIDPRVVDVADLRKAARVVSEQWGAPSEVMRTEKEVDEIDRARAEQEAQIAQQAQQQQAMEVAASQQQAPETEMANVAALEQIAQAGQL
jgi:hypothetical protein